MDSETRSSAGAIEAAHIAGLNSRQLVLVLHPYKTDQKILNEPISSQWVFCIFLIRSLMREENKYEFWYENMVWNKLGCCETIGTTFFTTKQRKNNEKFFLPTLNL